MLFGRGPGTVLRVLCTLGGYRPCRMNPAPVAQFRIERGVRTLLFHKEEALGCYFQKRLYPFLRIGFKTNAISGLIQERLKSGPPFCTILSRGTS